MKEIIANLDHTYTIRMIDGWSLTANASELEKCLINVLIKQYYQY